MSIRFHMTALLLAVAAVPAGTAAAEPIEELRATSGYKQGFFVRGADGPFSLTIQGRVQARYTYEMIDDAEDPAAFSIPRARLTLKGKAFADDISYKFQTDFGKGFVGLKDFYVDKKVKSGWLHLRAGQWKRPFSRQQINSSGRLELVDRAITDKFFGAGRDIGVAIHNGYEKSPTFEYALGVFNGTGDKGKFSGSVDPADLSVSGRFTNVPEKLHPAVVLRLGYNHGGIKGYKEADLEGGGFRFALGGSALTDLDTDHTDDSGIRAEADYVLKIDGFSTTGAIYTSYAQDGEALGDQALTASGYHLQAGYVVAGRFQPIARFASIAPDGTNNNVAEGALGLSVYFFEHGLKWQTDAAGLFAQAPGEDVTDYVIRSQIQMSF